MRKKLQLVTIFLFCAVFVMQFFVKKGVAMGPMSHNSNKKAILVIAFGTTYHTGERAIKDVNRMIHEEFPHTPIYWAYTSKIIRHILEKKGIYVPSPEIALAKLMDEGYKKVYVLSLHIIPGEEYHLLYSNAKLFSLMENGIKEIKITRPLVSTYADMQKITDILLNEIHLKKDEAFVFMGHGTEHPANAIYIALNAIFNKKNPRVFLATVEGHPTIYDIIPELKKKGIKKVYLMPFMLVAGDHANNDMAGNKPDSWKSILTREGFICKPIIKGLGENPEVVKLYIEHLKEIMKK